MNAITILTFTSLDNLHSCSFKNGEYKTVTQERKTKTTWYIENEQIFGGTFKDMI